MKGEAAEVGEEALAAAHEVCAKAAKKGEASKMAFLWRHGSRLRAQCGMLYNGKQAGMADSPAAPKPPLCCQGTDTVKCTPIE